MDEETSLNEENIINVVNGEQFAYLCQRFYARSQFQQYVIAIWFKSPFEPEFIKPERQLVTTQFGKVWAYSCQLRNSNNFRALSEADFSKHSVILLAEWNERRLFGYRNN